MLSMYDIIKINIKHCRVFKNNLSLKTLSLIAAQLYLKFSKTILSSHAYDFVVTGLYPYFG